MRVPALILALLLLSPATASAADQAAEGNSGDSRIGVPVTADEALRQKREMRDNLVALRETLAGLAAGDYTAVEHAVRRLGHSEPASTRPGVNVAAFADLERQFERSVDLTVEAAHSGNSRKTLEALSEMMGYCQSCHMAFRQATPAAATVK